MDKSFLDIILRNGGATPPIYEPGVIEQAIAPQRRSGTRHTIGVIADALATLGGAQPGYRAGIEHQQDREASLQRKGLLDQLTQAQIEAHRNPKPPVPFRFEANNGDQMEVGPDGQPRVLYKDPTQRMVRNYDGTWSVQPVAPTTPQAAPPGVTFKPLGGAPQTGARTFPIR